MSLLARSVRIDRVDDARRLARRVGLSEESAQQATGAIARPMNLLLTGLAPRTARALADAGRRPEQEGSGAMVLTAGGDAVLVSGSVRDVFALATVLGQSDRPEVEEAAGVLARCLRRNESVPAGIVVGGSTLKFDGRTLVMGIVNVTPDSFSDGGAHDDLDAAVAHGRRLVDEGADLLDVGGESTRPGADGVPAQEELRRVVPVIERLASVGVPISIDTTKAEVARAALEAGATLVNDVSGLSADPELGYVVASAGAALVVMHMRGTPREMQQHTNYTDLVGEVIASLAQSIERAHAAGVDEGRVIVDPGIGFAKSAEQNLALIRHTASFRTLGRPILQGSSRKSFIGKISGTTIQDRLPGTLAAITLGAHHGAHMMRVHDVAAARQALALTDAIDRSGDEGAAFVEGSKWWDTTDPRWSVRSTS